MSILAQQAATESEKPWLVGLRDYQLEARREVIKAWREGDNRVLLQLCTGAGKSIIIRSFLLELWLKNKRVLTVCQDSQILLQLHGHALSANIPESETGIIKAWKSSGGYPLALHKPIQVAMLQSLVNNWDELRNGLFPLSPDLIVIDEAHHCSSENTYYQLWEQFPTAKILGVTATPARPSGEGFYFPTEKGQPKKHLFDRLIVGVSKRTLIDRGFLPECETCFGLTPNLKGVAKSKGEYKVEGANGLESRYNSANIRGDLIRAWKEFVLDRFGAAPTMCFGVSVRHIQNIAADFSANGIPAVALHGGLTKAEQEAALKSFITGHSIILCLCGMGQEGFDLSTLAKSMNLNAGSVFCVIKALATTSLVKNSQLDGRVRGIDLMQWDWRSLPSPSSPSGSSDDPQSHVTQPSPYAAVLGGNSPLAGALVLGGIEGIKAALTCGNIAGRVAGIKKAIAAERLDLLTKCRDDPSPQVQALVSAILDNPELAIANKNKFLYGVIIDCGNNFEKLGTYDAEHEWSLDGVKAKPTKTKKCPECSLVGISLNAKKCPNCGHLFFEDKKPSEEGAVPRIIAHDKQCQMAILDKAAWRKWQELLGKHSTNHVAIKQFIKSGAAISEIVAAGRQCKTKEGRPYKVTATYHIWLDVHREIHGKSWLPELSTLEEWCKIINLPQFKPERLLEECREYAKVKVKKRND